MAALAGTDRDTGLNLSALEEIAAYFREVRKKYAQFEGSLKGTDSRILVAQVPGGMLTNMENQLREQGAADKFDAVLDEIPRVREDLGFIPLVTPTSQIVGTQAVINVLMGERYKTISKEVQGVLKGEYGAAPAPYNAELQARVLDGGEAITCRPADLLEPEMTKLAVELKNLAAEKSIQLATGAQEIDDVLTYALFPQIGLKFLENRGDASAFEPVPVVGEVAKGATSQESSGVYTVKVNGQSYVVEVADGGEIKHLENLAVNSGVASAPTAAPVASSGVEVNSPLAGNIFKVLVKPGDAVEKNQVIIIMEAMKMETEIRAAQAGTVGQVAIREGDAVQVGDLLLTL